VKNTSIGTGVFSSEDQRASLLAGVLSWLVCHMESFDLPQEDALSEGDPAELSPGVQRKAFAELGVALLIANRAPSIQATTDFKVLRRFWLDTAKTRRIFFDARRRIRLIPLMSVALVVFGGLDKEQIEAKRSLQNVLDRGFFDRVERAAHPVIDLKFYLDAAGLHHSFPDDEIILAHSSIFSPPSMPYAQRMDLYAITHLIFHLSDFCLKDIRRLIGSHLADLREYLSIAMMTMYAERDLDLVGEFLISRICLRQASDEIDRECVAIICDQQQSSGFIPACSWQRLRLGDEHQKVPEFRDVYHSTLVALILIACDLSCPRLPIC